MLQKETEQKINQLREKESQTKREKLLKLSKAKMQAEKRLTEVEKELVTFQKDVQGKQIQSIIDKKHQFKKLKKAQIEEEISKLGLEWENLV